MNGIKHEAFHGRVWHYLFVRIAPETRGSNSIINHSSLQNKTQLVVSRLSFLECRIMPLKEKNTNLLKSYDLFFQLLRLQIIELTADAINKATDLRARYS